MSLIVLTIAAGIAAAAAAAGAALGSRALRRRVASRVGPTPDESAPVAPALPGIEMQLGDVVLFGQEEVWLRGALLFEEARTCVAALFFTHQGPEGDVVLVQPTPERLVLRMCSVAVDQAGPPPSVVEHDGRRYTRKMRRPVIVRRLGGELPDVNGEATWAWYEAADGNVLATLVSGARTLAWTADPTADSSAVRLAAGSATFRSES